MAQRHEPLLRRPCRTRRLAPALCRLWLCEISHPRKRFQRTGKRRRPSTSSCATLDALRAAAAAGALHLAAVTTVSGYKTSCWRSLVPALTASYDYVWLRDSDVYADPHLFSLREVEFWVTKRGAAVAQPTILPLDGRSKSHGWWTPFRSAFHGGCLAQSTPIVEQMTPIFERAAFDAFRQKLASVPQELLRTDSGDFGLETFWCGLAGRLRAHQSRERRACRHADDQTACK